jgi:hypothetical protein
VVDNSSLTANALTNEAERRKQETAMNDAGRVADISTLDANFISYRNSWKPYGNKI